DGLSLMLRRLRLVVWRHLAAAQLHDDFVPSLAIVDQGFDRRECLEVQIFLVLLVAMAWKAVLGEERLDDPLEPAGRSGCQRSRLPGPVLSHYRRGCTRGCDRSPRRGWRWT